ncbi:MAG: tRNA (adenosine(37)-N6)-threonylcarbamoyltransferase complex transferase subunit TsaD [Candidatus Niyogibacteria bacterium]|nr:tRNA (adenosine(37)-N6)-threonylcarbamoyltransferase complex transferase subunit TsaD [Candidatus Niyogibacteria bacterium]
MRILAIETSCDETAAAVLECQGGPTNTQYKILSNIVSSQIKIHAQWGGVVPNLARREHEKNLVPILLRALKKAKISINEKRKVKSEKTRLKIQKILEREQELQKYFLKKVLPIATPDINAIAVTFGPGLEPALWTGINFAKTLSAVWDKPLIPVNHLEGHIVSSIMRGREFDTTEISFPALALLVSGGHTELVLMKKWLDYKTIGKTRDDAVGEAFDKVAKLLNLGYPGGPIISKRASLGNPKNILLPRPMINSADLDFSFSGLKTAVLYAVRKEKSISAQKISDYAASFQKAATDVLVSKTLRAIKKYHPRTVLLGGGVSANQELRTKMREQLKRAFPKIKLLLPEQKFTGDNAAMIAAAGYLRYANRKIRKNPLSLKAEGSLKFMI